MNWNSLKCAWFISRQQTSHLFFFFCCLNTWSRARFGYCVPTSPPSPPPPPLPHPPATSRSTNQALRVTDVFERVFPVAAAQRESVSVWLSKKQKRSIEFLTFAGRQVFKKKKTKRCHDLLIYWFIDLLFFVTFVLKLLFLRGQKVTNHDIPKQTHPPTTASKYRNTPVAMATAGGPAPFFFKLIGFCDDASPLLSPSACWEQQAPRVTLTGMFDHLKDRQ